MNQLNVNLPELPYAVSEAMNRLRINIKFCGKNTRKILLTSCQPNEGKSTISSYLWKMLAEAGFPTVLVDVDLRKSVMKTRFQMDYDDDTTMGLNHYLSGMAEYEDVIYSTNIPNGYMVPCTQLLENPSALLEDVRFKELLNTLSENYRFVIIDSPPLGSVSDGALIASLCDGAVLVVRAGTVFAADSPVKTSFNASLTKKTVTYTGKKQQPKVVVKNEAGKTIKAKYYTVKVKTCKHSPFLPQLLFQSSFQSSPPLHEQPSCP